MKHVRTFLQFWGFYGCLIQVGLAVVFLVSPLFAATPAPPQNPNSAKACAICHYRWIGTFFVQGRGTDLVPYQSEKVAATKEMCISCHDGSIKDSREKLMHGKGHKTGIKPPPDMKIPDIFPLDAEGKVQCATCHTAHGVPSGPGIKETIFLRVSNRNSANCRMCHPEKDGGPKAGNHWMGMETAGKKTDIPKDLLEQGALSGTQPDQMICETCHVAHGSKSEGYLVKGAGDSGLCLTCHTDKNMFDRFGLRNGNHVVNIVPKGAIIPQRLFQTGAKLGYGGTMTCQTCHKIHDNPIKQPELLLVENQKSDLCLTCHTDKERVEKTKHNLGLFAKKQTNREGKTVAEAGVCSACHLPHKNARIPYGQYDNHNRTTALCLSCHAKGKMAQNDKLAGYTHPIGMSLTAKRTGIIHSLDLPLFDEYGVPNRSGKMTCATCHDTHGGLATYQKPATEAHSLPVSYRLFRKSSPQLCQTCHADKFSLDNTRHDLAKVFPNGNPILQQKVASADKCRNCHYIHHQTNQKFVWQKQIQTKTGDIVLDLCTQCHSQAGLAANMTLKDHSHPVNIDVKQLGYHSGPLPLFDATGKLKADGMMTCYSCHDPHRATPVKNANNQVMMQKGFPVSRFLRIDSAPGSDLCIICHVNQADVLKTDHNLAKSIPDAKNIAGETAFESGACGACHLIHNDKSGIMLWARTFGPGENVMNRMCNACHDKQGIAGQKVPQVATHPKTIIVDKGMVTGKLQHIFPLFDPNSGKRVRIGNMSCPSCHDAHRWSGYTQVQLDVIGQEGNALSSFLRPHLHDRVCKDCHGNDALFRLKYFHKASERKKQPHVR